MAVNIDDWEKRNRAYLKQISKLSFDNVRWNREKILEIRDFLGGWNHNIKLPYGVFTAYCDDYYPAHEEILKIINHQLNGNFANKRILDIGCLEGYFSSECALQGADVLGIDGKIINIKKYEFIKSVLGIKNVTFIKDDGMKITKSKYGSFDVVLALGFLYYLDNPFKFLVNMSKLCDGFILIDTHVALVDQPKFLGKEAWRPDLSPLKEFKFGKKTYWGRLYREYDSDETQLVRDLSTTASLKNDLSVWLTEDSLISLLRDVGFEQVSKVLFPKDEDAWWSNVQRDARVLLLAVKNRTSFKSRIFTVRRALA